MHADITGGLHLLIFDGMGIGIPGQQGPGIALWHGDNAMGGQPGGIQAPPALK
ncbi:MAG TPA: hypothetical protein VK463_14695 [Desulfomonilaceae bacterium]|nr:hypothetical protein [Desulfomonilaceae bacterium]